jgi:hypothetical protein
MRHPHPGEYAPFYTRYIERVREDPIEAMAAQGGATAALLAPLTDQQALHRYAPGKWSIKDIVGHLIDTERVMSYRALRFARGDATPLPTFDENQYAPAARAERRPLAELLAELRAVRQASLALFRGLPDEAWERRGPVGEHPMSVRALACIIPGHERHHVQVLKERYGIH